jgi:hypothetical protein
MTQTIRRILLPAVAATLIGLAGVGLVQAGMAIGRAAASTPAGARGAAPATDSTASADLSAELDAVLAADQTTTATGTDRAKTAGPALRRLAAWRHLVHGTVVVDLPKLGGLTTVQLDHGSISAVNATSLTIAEAGNMSITVALGSETRVRKNAAKAAIADLKAGDEVFVLSKVSADGTTAYLVVVPKN